MDLIEVNPQLRDFLMPENPGIEDLPPPILRFPGNFQIDGGKQISPCWAHMGLPNYQLGRPPGRLIGGSGGAEPPPGNKKFKLIFCCWSSAESQEEEEEEEEEETNIRTHMLGNFFQASSLTITTGFQAPL